MSLLGSLLKAGVKLGNMVVYRPWIDSEPVQRKELARLLSKARTTAFGKTHNFQNILSKALYRRDLSYYEAFKQLPVYDYSSMYRDWWYRVIAGEEDVCWPGQVKYFALSSGTSEASKIGRASCRETCRSVERSVEQKSNADR